MLFIVFVREENAHRKKYYIYLDRQPHTQVNRYLRNNTRTFMHQYCIARHQIKQLRYVLFHIFCMPNLTLVKAKLVEIVCTLVFVWMCTQTPLLVTLGAFLHYYNWTVAFCVCAYLYLYHFMIVGCKWFFFLLFQVDWLYTHLARPNCERWFLIQCIMEGIIILKWWDSSFFKWNKTCILVHCP